jgi:hypothetical protein
MPRPVAHRLYAADSASGAELECSPQRCTTSTNAV